MIYCLLKSHQSFIKRQSFDFVETSLPDFPDEKQVALFFEDSDYVAVYRVPERENGKYCLESDTRIDVKWKKSIFAYHRAVVFNDDLIEELKILSERGGLTPVIFQFSKNRRGDVDACLIDSSRRRFQKSHFDSLKWGLFEKEILRFYHDTDVLIKTNSLVEMKSHLSQGKRLMERMFQQAGWGKVDFHLIRRADVYLQGDLAVPPFELLNRNLLVRYLIPGKKETINKINADEIHFTYMYSNELNFAVDETKAVAGLLKGRWSLEILSDENDGVFHSDEDKAGIFHFAGHGNVIDGKGAVKIAGRWVENPAIGDDRFLALINACRAGSVSGGLVSSLAENGTMNVIASPYEIPDGSGGEVTELYHFINFDEFDYAFYLTCLSNKKFYYFYRLFKPYRQ